MSQNEGTSAAADDGGSTKRAGLSYPMMVLLTVAASVLLVNYVETMVIPGIPVIQEEMGTTETVASWITSAFLIVGAAVSPPFGKLGDMYGKKKMLLVVLGFYIVGIGIAGFADSIYVLLLARAVQGIGFATLPLAIAMVTEVFPREKVASAQGLISGTVAIGTTLGLVIGAYVVQDLGWHFAFHTTFALSVLMFAAAAKFLRKDVPGPPVKMDYAGTALLMAGITLVLIYLTEGPSRGWTSPDNLAFLVPGAALLGYFFVFESKRASPLIQLGLLKIRNVLLGNLIGIASTAVMFLAFFAVVYYAQLPEPYGLGLDVISTGLALAPATVAMMIVGPLVGRTVSRMGPKPVIVAGSAVMMLGFVLFVVNRSTAFDLTVDAIIAFSGMIAVIIPMVNMISMALPQDSMTVGLGMNSMLRNLGGAIGPVMATTIMTTYTASLIANIGGRPVVVGTTPSSAAFDLIFEAGIVLGFVILILGLAIDNYVLGKKAGEEQEHPAAGAGAPEEA